MFNNLLIKYFIITLSIVIILFVSSYFFEKFKLNEIGTITEEFYNYPLKVSNASKNIELEINKIYIAKNNQLFKISFLEHRDTILKNFNLIIKNISKNRDIELYRDGVELFLKVSQEIHKKEPNYQELTFYLNKIELKVEKLNQYALHEADLLLEKSKARVEYFSLIYIFLTIIFFIILIFYSTIVLKKIKVYIFAERELQDKLRVNESRFRGLFNNMDKGVVVYEIINNGEDFIFADLNRYAQKVFKIDKEDVIGESIFEVFPNINETEIINALKDVFNNSKATFLPPFKYKDEKIDGWFKGHIYKLPNGEIVAICDDITEKKEYEDKILLFKTVIDNSSDAILIIDYETKKFVDINDTAIKMLNYRRVEFFNLTIFDIDTKFKNLKDLEECIDENREFYGDKYFYYETEFKRKEDGVIAVEVGLNRIKMDDRIYLVSIARDITERKVKELELKEKEELMIAQSRQAAMGDMIAMIAHQWRQPISTISMASNNILLDLALDKLDRGELERVLQEINEQVRHLSQTIDDFRNFFKPNKDKTPKDIATIINEVLNIIGKSLEANSISLMLDIKFNEQIITYPSELVQVLLNILNNAKDVVKERNIKNPHIKIFVNKMDEYIEINLCDNAGGIDKSIIDKIFEPYFTTKEKTGTGLGLYMSKVIIEKHLQGEIKVKNDKYGACFTILIPKILK